MRRFLSWQLEAGVPGVIVLGTTGEFLTVSDDERAELVDTAVKHVAGRVPVLVGTMNAYTRARRRLQPAGRGAGGRRADDPAAVLLHPHGRRDLPLLRCHLRRRRPAHNAVQQPRDVQRRHVCGARGPAGQGVREHPLHKRVEPRHRPGERGHRSHRGGRPGVCGRAPGRLVPARRHRLREPLRQLHPPRLQPDVGAPRGGSL